MRAKRALALEEEPGVGAAGRVDRQIVGVGHDVAGQVVLNEDVVRFETEPAVQVEAELDLPLLDELVAGRRESGNRWPRCPRA